mmetsp:Transcript_30387/g.69323  ORF Transcript_30387/g.69323 Transcript_30387/m.69323 type:complete len:92 (-) Transcript_30387:3-278(-)
MKNMLSLDILHRRWYLSREDARGADDCRSDVSLIRGSRPDGGCTKLDDGETLNSSRIGPMRRNDEIIGQIKGQLELSRAASSIKVSTPTTL